MNISAVETVLPCQISEYRAKGPRFACLHHGLSAPWYIVAFRTFTADAATATCRSQFPEAVNMAPTPAARPLTVISIAVSLLLAMAAREVHAESTLGSQPTLCTGSHEHTETVIHPGDEVSEDVLIDSLDPVDEEDAFGEYLASRRLLQCRKCKCLPRCSRCLIISCKTGVCRGLCRMPSATQNCALLRCSRSQEAHTV